MSTAARANRAVARRLAAATIIVGLPMAAAGSVGADSNAIQRGKDVYERGCVSCHGIDGEGAMPGVPDLTTSGGPLSKSDSVLLKSLRDGVQSPGSTMAMPPKGGNPSLMEADLRDVLTYLRRTFAGGAK